MLALIKGSDHRTKSCERPSLHFSRPIPKVQSIGGRLPIMVHPRWSPQTLEFKKCRITARLGCKTPVDVLQNFPATPEGGRLSEVECVLKPVSKNSGAVQG